MRPQEKSKCESCVVPTSQKVRVRPRQIQEHKPFRKRWKLTPQKQGNKNPKAETSKGKAAKTEEAPTALASGSWLAPRQSAGAIKGRNRPRQRGQHTWNVKASAPGNIRIAPKQAKDRAPVVLNHHIFDPKSGRGKGTARKQPAPRLSIQPYQSVYSNPGIHTPQATPRMVDGTADTGAQVRLWSAPDFNKPGYVRRDLIRGNQQVAQVDRQPIRVMGAAFLTVEADSIEINPTAPATLKIQGPYQPRQALADHRHFPARP